MECYMISSRAICFLAAWMPECSKIKQKKNIFVMVTYLCFLTVFKIGGIWLGWEADTEKFHEIFFSKLTGITVGEQLWEIRFGVL